MSKGELTKQLLANTLKQLMVKTPLDKISVQDIVDACSLNRKTFYYHFHDKQDLICWIFDSEFAGLHDQNHNNTIIDELIELLYQNRDFYIAALTSNVQNNLRDHLYKVAYKAIHDEISEILGNRQMAEKDRNFIAAFFSNALIGCLFQWARDRMKKSPYEDNLDFILVIRETLEFIINKRVNIAC